MKSNLVRLATAALGALILYIFLAIFGAPANATNTPQPTPSQSQGQGQSQSASAASSAHSRAAADARSASVSAATGGAGGDARATAAGGAGGAGGSVTGVVGGSADGGSASNSTTVNGDTVRIPRQAPPAFAVLGNTTAECYTSTGVGFSTPVGGVSFGTGRKARDCSRLALAYAFYDRGQDEAGDRMVCSITEVKQALGAECLYLLRGTRQQAAQRVDTSQFVTREELLERERRMDRVTRKVGK